MKKRKENDEFLEVHTCLILENQSSQTFLLALKNATLGLGGTPNSNVPS